MPAIVRSDWWTDAKSECKAFRKLYILSLLSDVGA